MRFARRLTWIRIRNFWMRIHESGSASFGCGSETLIQSILIQGLMKAGCRGEDAVAVDSSSPEPSSKRPTESRSSQRPAANTPSLSSNSPTRTPVRRRNAKRELWSLGPDISARKKVLISRAFFYKHIHWQIICLLFCFCSNIRKSWKKRMQKIAYNTMSRGR